jgi:hypothetical protein
MTTNIHVKVQQPGGASITPSPGQRSVVQSVPNTNPTTVTVDDNNPALRLGSLVSNTACTALIANVALLLANTANATANAAYAEANLANALAFTANTLAQSAIILALAANTEAQSAAQSVTVYAPNTTLLHKTLSFQNTASINVSVLDDGIGNAVISLIGQGGQGHGNGNGTVNSITTGLGLNGGVINISGTIAANIASETTQGVTKLIDSVTSYDTGNAATANAVTSAYSLAAYANAVAANTITQNTQLLMANVISSNTIELDGVEQSTTVLQTTANGVQVVIDMFPAYEFSTFKYLIQARSVDSIHSLELLCVQDGINTYSTQYGSVYTTTQLGDFEINVWAGSVVLYITPTNPLFHIITIKVLRQSITS